MSRSGELWEVIKDRIVQESLLTTDELNKLEPRILSSRVSQDDWSTAIMNSNRRDAEDDDRTE